MRNLLHFLLRNYIIFLFLALEGLSFLLIFQFNSFQKSAFISYTRTVTSGLQEKFSGLQYYFYLRYENEVLAEENARLRTELLSKNPLSDSPAFQGDSLIQSLYQFIPARIINCTVNKQNNYITINKGYRQGVYPDMAVITETGAVGIVIAVSENYSTVIPILNRSFRLSSRLKKNNYFGIVEWEGRSAQYVSLKEIPVHVDVQPGDTVVTSGFSAVFPEGITVGVVDRVENTGGNFFDIRLRLSTDYRKLYHVNLIRFSRKAEFEELENRSRDD